MLCLGYLAHRMVSLTRVNLHLVEGSCGQVLAPHELGFTQLLVLCWGLPRGCVGTSLSSPAHTLYAVWMALHP